VNFSDGAGIVEPHATGIIKEVNAIKTEAYDALPEDRTWHAHHARRRRWTPTYLDACEDADSSSLSCWTKAKGLKIVYTALHGTGGVLGASDPGANSASTSCTVPEQDVPGRYASPPVESPNPENAPTLQMATDLRRRDWRGCDHRHRPRLRPHGRGRARPRQASWCCSPAIKSARSLPVVSQSRQCLNSDG